MSHVRAIRATDSCSRGRFGSALNNDGRAAVPFRLFTSARYSVGSKEQRSGPLRPRGGDEKDQRWQSGHPLLRTSPSLWDAITTLSEEVWPAYNLHGDVLGGCRDRLYDEFAESQFVLYDDEAHDVIAEGHTIPCDWDGTAEGLGMGSTPRSRPPSRPDRDVGRRPRCARSRRRSDRASKAPAANRMLDVTADLAHDADVTT